MYMSASNLGLGQSDIGLNPRLDANVYKQRQPFCFSLYILTLRDCKNLR